MRRSWHSPFKSAHGAASTVRFRRFLQVYVSKRYGSLEPIEVSVFSSRLVNISSIRWKSGHLWTKPTHLDSHVWSLSVAIFGTIVISLTICINVLPVPFPWVKLFSWPFWTFILPPFRFHFKSSLCVHRPQTSRPRGFSPLSSSRCILHQIPHKLPKEKKNSRRLILRVTPLYRPQFGCNRRSERGSFHWSDWRATIYRFSGTYITYISMTNGASTQ